MEMRKGYEDYILLTYTKFVSTKRKDLILLVIAEILTLLLFPAKALLQAVPLYRPDTLPVLKQPYHLERSIHSPPYC